MYNDWRLFSIISAHKFTVLFLLPLIHIVLLLRLSSFFSSPLLFVSDLSRMWFITSLQWQFSLPWYTFASSSFISSSSSVIQTVLFLLPQLASVQLIHLPLPYCRMFINLFQKSSHPNWRHFYSALFTPLLFYQAKGSSFFSLPLSLLCPSAIYQ